MYMPYFAVHAFVVLRIDKLKRLQDVSGCCKIAIGKAMRKSARQESKLTGRETYMAVSDCGLQVWPAKKLR